MSIKMAKILQRLRGSWMTGNLCLTLTRLNNCKTKQPIIELSCITEDVKLLLGTLGEIVLRLKDS